MKIFSNKKGIIPVGLLMLMAMPIGVSGWIVHWHFESRRQPEPIVIECKAQVQPVQVAQAAMVEGDPNEPAR